MVAELLGRVDVEALPSKLEDAFAHACQLGAEPLRKAAEHSFIDAHAGPLHAIKHRRKRQIDLAIDAIDRGLFNLCAKIWNQRMNRRSFGGNRIRRRGAMARGDVGQRLRGVGWIQRVGKQHEVVDCAAQIDTQPAENMQSQLPVVGLLGNVRVFHQRAQFGCERQAQRARGIGAYADTRLRLSLGSFDGVEQRRSRRLFVFIFCCRFRSIESKGKAAGARSTVKLRNLLPAWILDNLNRRTAGRRPKLLEHGSEFKLGV